jgi:hypothetical protein
MVDLLLIRIGFVVCFANAFCDDFGIALRMTRVFAVRALHAGRVL